MRHATAIKVLMCGSEALLSGRATPERRGIIVGKQWVMMDLVPIEAFIGGGLAGEPQVIGQGGQPREVNLGPLGEGGLSYLFISIFPCAASGLFFK